MPFPQHNLAIECNGLVPDKFINADMQKRMLLQVGYGECYAAGLTYLLRIYTKEPLIN